MGLNSCSALFLACNLGKGTPMSREISRSSSSVFGRNSCKGGSRSRMVTGSPSITLKIPMKSFLCIGRIFRRALFLPAVSSARIISRTACTRSASKNMCSVRTSPIPSAPNFNALRASAGVSALARIPSSRISSAHFMMVWNSPERSGATRGTIPRMTSPVVPFKVMCSPSLMTCGSRTIVFCFSSI
jgi:hypothetical protein